MQAAPQDLDMAQSWYYLRFRESLKVWPQLFVCILCEVERCLIHLIQNVSQMLLVFQVELHVRLESHIDHRCDLKLQIMDLLREFDRVFGLSLFLDDCITWRLDVVI